ncbi:MAG TPA: cytochrome c oxidase assembly protein [Dongiaceae bacterium]
MAERTPLQQRDRRNRRLMLVLSTVVVAMVGLAYASVPLYRIFCAVTGYQGTPRIASSDSSQVIGRMVTVTFTADVSNGLGWRFQPKQHQMQVQVGKSYLAFFEAENLENKPVTGRATYNISPDPYASYFTKTACFCFTQQTLQPGQKIDMPVSFYIDAEMAKDPTLSQINDVTLSYTFFRAADQAPAAAKVGVATPAVTGEGIAGSSQKSSVN